MSSSTYYATRRIFNSALVLFRVDATVKNKKKKKKRGVASKNSIAPRYWHYCTACGATSKGRDWLFYCTFNWDCQSGGHVTSQGREATAMLAVIAAYALAHV